MKLDFILYLIITNLATNGMTYKSSAIHSSFINFVTDQSQMTIKKSNFERI